MSSDTKWSAGPWFVDFYSGNHRADVWSRDDALINRTNGLSSGLSDNQIANANLIAAAPELYDALDKAVKDLVAAQVNARVASRTDSQWIGVSEVIQKSVDSARKALAKARGES